MIDELTGLKCVSPAQMIEIMKKVPSESRICVNKVGNLSAYNEKWEFIGFVDLNSEVWEPTEPPFRSILQNPL